MKTILKTAKHEIKIPNSAEVGHTKDISERIWRDSELARTDIFPDDAPDSHINKLKAYRKELREYPNKAGFPDISRPALK